MKDKIESSEQSVIKLKRHIKNGTCPPDLSYDAKANIFPDEDFKSDNIRGEYFKARHFSIPLACWFINRLASL